MRNSQLSYIQLKGKTQCEQIHWYMLKYGKITTREAMQDLGCYRLASRIHDLKNMGIFIDKEMVTVYTRWGTSTQVASYSIDPYFVREEESRIFGTDATA